MIIKIITDATGSMEAMWTTENPVTAKAFLDALPITGRANTWGDEILPASEVNVFGRTEMETRLQSKQFRRLPARASRTGR